MTWGLNVYSRHYVDNINELFRSGRSPEDWTLPYEEAIGREFPKEGLTNSKLQRCAISSSCERVLNILF